MHLSDSQFKLATLVLKVKPLVTFASDTSCEELFATVAKFAADILLENDRKQVQDVQGMELEDLLNLVSREGLLDGFFLFFFLKHKSVPSAFGC